MLKRHFPPEQLNNLLQSNHPRLQLAALLAATVQVQHAHLRRAPRAGGPRTGALRAQPALGLREERTGLDELRGH